MKYRKTALIEAEQYKPGMEDGIDNRGPYLNTLEGKLYIPDGGHIATGVEGERWAIKHSIFKKTYAVWNSQPLSLVGCLSPNPYSKYMTRCKLCIHSMLDNQCAYTCEGQIRVYNM